MRLANVATSTIPFTAGQDGWGRDQTSSQPTPALDGAPDWSNHRPAVNSGFVTMVTILSGFAVFWLVAGFGLGYWVGS